MAKTVVLYELHLTFRIPATLPDAAVTSVRRTLTSRGFMTRLKAAVRAVVKAYPELAVVKVSFAR